MGWGETQGKWEGRGKMESTVTLAVTVRSEESKKVPDFQLQKLVDVGAINESGSVSLSGLP